MKYKLVVVIWCISILAIILFAWIANIPQYEPEEGVWVCDELQIQLDYDSGKESFIIGNGVKIHCGHGSDRGVKRVLLYSQDFTNSDYELGEIIFAADITKLTEAMMTVYDPQTEKEYIFVRIDVAP